MIGNKPETGERLIDGAYVNGIAAGQNFESASGLVAHAGGGQASATPLPLKALIAVSTVATAADSVVLPVSDAGMSMTVINTSANSLDIYASPLANHKNGDVSDKINGEDNDTAYALAAGAIVQFVCAKAGNWYALLGATPE